MADLGGLLPTNSLNEDILFEIDCLEDAVSQWLAQCTSEVSSIASSSFYGWCI